MKRRDLLLAAALSPVASLAKAMPNPSLDALKKIGRAALAQGAVPADPAALRAALGLHRHATLSDHTGSLNAKVAEDFAAGHTVQVDGWVMSETEACVCAWIALQEEGA
ncbi:hypothetical protein J7400_18150 [Shimia sp. R9_2]|uniref:hypothetical protein n=1 Tax=Shimia sp. R9_2 TaxID=2821112 RepID=UPI001ADB0B87|nr:hypothetical protein [Shimia sp. R9_2]MBO9398600.1 hypothetical protein [Shimia sp. R9_2]